MQLPYRTIVRIKKCEDLQSDLGQACLDYGGQFYQETLSDWENNVMSLKGTDWFHENLSGIHVRRFELESKLPNVSDSEFDRYCLFNDLLARLLEV